MPHRPQRDPQPEHRHRDGQEIQRRRIRAAARQHRAEEAAQAPERREQDEEPSQLPRRGIVERQQPLRPVATREQKLADQPRDAHGDDRDQHFEYRNPPQRVPLPEGEEQGQKGQREHGDSPEVEGETDNQSKRAGREGLRRRWREPLAIRPQGQFVAALRQPADQQRRRHQGTDERQHRRSFGFVQLRDDFAQCLRQRDERVPELAETLPHHPGVLLDHSRHCPGALRLRRCRGAIELVEQKLSHLLVGQARHELAHRFVRQRFRQRRRFRLGRLGPGCRRNGDGRRTGHRHGADGDCPAHSIEHVHHLAPGESGRGRHRIVIQRPRLARTNRGSRPTELRWPPIASFTTIGPMRRRQPPGMNRSAHQLNTMSRSAAPSSSPYRSRSRHCCSRAYSPSSSVTTRSLTRMGTLAKLGV